MIEGMRKLLLGSVLAAVALTACANTPAAPPRGGDATNPAAILRAAAAKTMAAGSARLAFTFAIQTGGQTQSFTGDAAVDFGGGDPTKTRAQMRFAFPKGAGPDLGSIEMTIDAGPVIYLRSKLLSGFLGAKTPWIKIDPSTVPGLSAQLGSLTGGQTDPSGSFQLLFGLLDVKVAGVETIDGAPATRYRGTFDLSKALEQVPEAQREWLQQVVDGLKQQTGGADLPPMPIDVWVDADGYLKQIRYQIEVPKSQAAEGGSFAATILLSEVGAPVDIQPPPADQVTDIAGLMPAGSSPSP